MRLIDADRLKRVLEINFGHTGGAAVLAQLIDEAPTVDAVEVVRHGKWIVQDTSRTKFMCSECKSKNYGGHEKYCQNCGARMDGE